MRFTEEELDGMPVGSTVKLTGMLTFTKKPDLRWHASHGAKRHTEATSRALSSCKIEFTLEPVDVGYAIERLQAEQSGEGNVA